MPIIYEFSRAIEKQRSQTNDEWFCTRYSSYKKYDYNSFLQNNQKYHGTLNSLGIPNKIQKEVQILENIKPPRNLNEPAYAGVYVDKTWAILAVATNIGEYENEQQFNWKKRSGETPRPFYAHRYFCCENETNKPCDLMATLIDWFNKNNRPQFEFDFIPFYEKEIEAFSQSEEKTESAKTILDNLDNQHQEIPFEGSIEFKDLFSLISNLPEEEKIGFSFAFNVTNSSNLKKEGYFRLIQGKENIIYLIKRNQTIIEKQSNFYFTNFAKKIKSIFEKLKQKEVDNELIISIIELLAPILKNLDGNEDLLQDIFEKEFNIQEYLSGDKPPHQYIIFSLIQTILLPEKVRELVNLKTKFIKKNRLEQLQVLNDFENQLFEIIKDCRNFEFNNFYQEFQQKKEANDAQAKNLINNEVQETNKLPNSNKLSSNLKKLIESKIIANLIFKIKIKKEFPFFQINNSAQQVQPTKEANDDEGGNLTNNNESTNHNNSEVENNKAENTGNVENARNTNNDYSDDNSSKDKKQINYAQYFPIIPIVDKLLAQLYQAIWECCIYQTVESTFDDSSTSSSNQRTNNTNNQDFLAQIFRSKRHQNNSLLDENNYLKVLTQNSALWDYLLRTRVAMDFYCYLNKYDSYLNQNFTKLIKYFYENNGKPNLQRKVYPNFLDIWEDKDPVVAYFFESNIKSRKPKKIQKIMEESEYLKPYLDKDYSLTRRISSKR